MAETSPTNTHVRPTESPARADATTEELLTEIDQARERLGQDLTVLESRLPDREQLRTGAAIAGGATAAATMGLLLLRRALHNRRERRMARAIGAEALTGFIDATPPEPHTPTGNRGVLGLVLGVLVGAGAGVALANQR